ncbi:MAG: thioesterase domain-containing protein, partial [Verrucomicrobiota bacterium]|nr:thioesterase domain-containing protein [Verrucomicrobiota bacterium]
QLAAILKEEGTQHWSTIVDIQPSGSKPPIFWIHSLGGDGGGGFFYYRRLAELLGPDQPSFGIRSPQEPFDRIDLMARHYIREIKKRQPNGPYFLGGFCFGGNVAYEMATQLVEQGEKVGMLILLESSPPKTVDANAGFNANAALYSIENLYENLKDFVHQDASSQLAALKQKSQQWRKRIQNKLAPQQEKPQLKEVIDMSHYPKDYVKYAETHWEAINHFVPRPFPGQIHLFRARKQPLRSFNPTFGWEQLVEDRVHVTVIPGTHESMLQEPNVQVLANKLNQLLAQSHGLVTGSTRLAA